MQGHMGKLGAVTKRDLRSTCLSFGMGLSLPGNQTASVSHQTIVATGKLSARHLQEEKGLPLSGLLWEPLEKPES